MPDVHTITATQMHRKRGSILRRCSRNREHFIVEKDGIPIVAIIPIGEYEAEFSTRHSTLANNSQ